MAGCAVWAAVVVTAVLAAVLGAPVRGVGAAAGQWVDNAVDGAALAEVPLERDRLSHLPVKFIKQLVAARRLSCGHCNTKAEWIDFLLDHADAPVAAPEVLGKNGALPRKASRGRKAGGGAPIGGLGGDGPLSTATPAPATTGGSGGKKEKDKGGDAPGAKKEKEKEREEAPPKKEKEKEKEEAPAKKEKGKDKEGASKKEKEGGHVHEAGAGGGDAGGEQAHNDTHAKQPVAGGKKGANKKVDSEPPATVSPPTAAEPPTTATAEPPATTPAAAEPTPAQLAAPTTPVEASPEAPSPVPSPSKPPRRRAPPTPTFIPAAASAEVHPDGGVHTP